MVMLQTSDDSATGKLHALQGAFWLRKRLLCRASPCPVSRVFAVPSTPVWLTSPAGGMTWHAMRRHMHHMLREQR